MSNRVMVDRHALPLGRNVQGVAQISRKAWHPRRHLIGGTCWMVLAFALLGAPNVYGHPGGRAADGCHFCRTNCERWNEVPDQRHCHSVPAERAPQPHEIRRLDYEGFTVWIDCSRRGAVLFRYSATRDTGNLPRRDEFSLDAAVPDRCEQTSTDAYRRPDGATPTYDRGHLVPANHLDHSRSGIAESNTMTNVLPQVRQMNRGAWLRTEQIVECYRDIADLTVWGGVLWGDDVSDDHFVETHGVATPDGYWKVVARGDDAIAWIIPNRAEATWAQLDSYLASVGEVEARAGLTVPIDESLKRLRPETSWVLPAGCEPG